MSIYLYVKTHNKTGLKYLGKTTKPDPHTYRGSGVDWKAHLKEHGADYTTEIIKECQTNQELNEHGRYYSNLWNVANSPEWANRIPETGGGATMSPEEAKKISQRLKGKKKPPRTAEHKLNLSVATKGKPRPRSEDHQLAWTAASVQNWKDNTARKEKTALVGKANKGRKCSPEVVEKRRQSMLLYWKIKKSREI
jgi:hypothetical protein